MRVSADGASWWLFPMLLEAPLCLPRSDESGLLPADKFLRREPEVEDGSAPVNVFITGQGQLVYPFDVFGDPPLPGAYVRPRLSRRGEPGGHPA